MSVANEKHLKQRTSHKSGQKKIAKGVSITNIRMMMALVLSEFVLMAISTSQSRRIVRGSEDR